MYLDYFGFDEPPFSITPDPQFVFLSKKHQESLAHLIYGMTRGGGAGFVQLTGEVGTGKTTISRLLLEQIPEKTNVALILNPSISPLELLESICQEFGIDCDNSSPQMNRLIDQINTYLLDSWSRGEYNAVILDEAQNLPRDTLEQLRILTNLETDKQKLLQIILIGQPELRSTMRRNDLRQLAQRVTARYHLLPLSLDETHDYLQHRIKVAGASEDLINKPLAQSIHRFTGGVPRLINTLTDRAFLAAYSAGDKKLNKQHIKTAAAEVLPESHQSTQASALKMPLLLLAGTLFLLFGYLITGPWQSDDRATEAVMVEGRLVNHNDDDSQVHEFAKDELVFRAASAQSAWQAYFELWGANSEQLWQKAECPSSADIGMACLRRQGNLNQVSKLNHPVLLHLQDGTLVLLSGVDDGKIGLLNDKQQVSWLAKSWIDQKWYGTYFILWPMPAELLLDTNASALKKWSLAMANTIASVPVNQQQLSQWIITFQSDHGLLADGIIGPETQMALSLMAYSGPLLTQ